MKKIYILLLVFLVGVVNVKAHEYELWGIGKQNEGELGNGFKVFTNTPIQFGNKGEWKDFSSGGKLYAGLRFDGTLRVWGNDTRNSFGKYVSDFNNSFDEEIESDIKWSKVVAGTYTICGIKVDGTLWIWGYNNADTDKNSKNLFKPTLVRTQKKDWLEIYRGLKNFYVKDSSGKIFNVSTKHTDDSFYGGNILSPLEINDLQDAIYVCDANSDFGVVTIFLKNDSTLWGWGVNVHNIFANENATNKFSLSQIGTLKWKILKSNYRNVVAVDFDNNVYWWEHTNDFNYNYDDYKPQIIKFEKNIKLLDFDDFNIYLTDINDDLYLAGYNTNVISEKYKKYYYQFEKIFNLKVKNIICNFYKNYILDYSNTLYIPIDSSQSNISNYGKLQKINSHLWSSLTIHKNTNVMDFSWYEKITRTSSYFIDIDNYLWGCGFNNLGLFGDKNNINKPLLINNDKWKYFTSNANLGFGIKVDGSLWAIGINDKNQFLDTNIYDKKYFKDYNIKTNFDFFKVGTNNNWKKILCSKESVIALDNDGEVWVWGNFNEEFLNLEPNNNTIKKIRTQEKIKDFDFKHKVVTFLSETGVIYILGKSPSSDYYTDMIGTYDSIYLDYIPKKINYDYKINSISMSDYNLAISTENKQYSNFIDFSNFRYWSSYSLKNEVKFEPTYIDGNNIKTVVLCNDNYYAIKNDSTLWGAGRNYNNILSKDTNSYYDLKIIDSNHVWVDLTSTDESAFFLRVTDEIKNSISETSFHNFKITPNPVTDRFRLELSNEIANVKIIEVKLIDALGKVILDNIDNFENINISNLPTGNYFIQIKYYDKNIKSETLKLVKE